MNLQEHLKQIYSRNENKNDERFIVIKSYMLYIYAFMSPISHGKNVERYIFLKIKYWKINVKSS